MSKYSIKDLWNEIYGTREEVYDYAGRLMLKSACGNYRIPPSCADIYPRRLDILPSFPPPAFAERQFLPPASFAFS